MKSQTTPQFVSDRDLALRYGVCVSTIWRWAQKGRIPQPLRLGPNTTRWNIADVDAALAVGDAETDGGVQ